jgi:parallel beta-helix repeat protein
MANWVIEHNVVRDNNRPNAAVPGTFQSALPPGIGILVAGVSGHSILKNNVSNNGFVGIALLGGTYVGETWRGIDDHDVG